MQSSEYSQITDELLSAYIDGDVTEREKNLIEEAIAGDAEIAWRLESLQMTVQLLNELPDMPLLRSFTLESMPVPEAAAQMPTQPLHQQEATVQPVPQSPSTPPHITTRPVSSNNAPLPLPSLWERWQSFWAGGNLLLRNAAVAALVLFVVLVGSNIALPRNIQNSSTSDTVEIQLGAQPDAETIAQSEPAQDSASLEPASAEATVAELVPPEPAQAEPAQEVALAPTATQAVAALAEEPPSPSVASAESASAPSAARTFSRPEDAVADQAPDNEGAFVDEAAAATGLKVEAADSSTSASAAMARESRSALQSFSTSPLTNSTIAESASVQSSSIARSTRDEANSDEVVALPQADQPPADTAASDDASDEEPSGNSASVAQPLPTMQPTEVALATSATAPDAIEPENAAGESSETTSALFKTDNANAVNTGQVTTQPTSPAVSSNQEPATLRLLQMGQLIVGLSSLILGGLWLRSRA